MNFPIKWKSINHTANYLLRESVKTTHSRIIACGLLVVMGFLFIRLGKSLLFSLRGFSSGVLTLGVVFFGAWMIWKERDRLQTLRATDEDRLLGYILILSGVLLFPFCFSIEWQWAMICAVIMGGAACSTWGVVFFRICLPSTLLITFGLLPEKSQLVRALWQTFTPPAMLERFMAWAASLGLWAMGQPAVVQQDVITLAGKSVQVQWGCNGFDMALEVTVVSLLIGLFFKQRRSRTLMLIVIGIVLALLFNIPRVILLAMAEAYWGKSSFDFWHGFWGGQIFTAILFTVYYYVVMAIIKQKSGQGLKRMKDKG